MLDDKVVKIATGLFGHYYEKADLPISNVSEREFGFGTFEKKIAFRHYSFKSLDLLKKHMVKEPPAFVHYSSSLYSYPDARPMEKKMWKGSSLIFDLDASDLHLKCQTIHGRGWVCQNCLDSVKAEVIKLVEDFLVPDFGFSKEEIRINFSGNRGYHVNVSSKDVFMLDSPSRKAISDYISGLNMNIESFFPMIGQRGMRLTGPKESDYGWGGRLARSMVSALERGTDSLAALGIEPAMARKLYANKAIITSGIRSGNWDMVKIPKKAEFWSNVMKNMAIAQSDSIDRNVTNDIYHLIRIPGTLHGETGLVGKIVSMSQLDGFDPMKDAIVFRQGVMKIRTEKVPSFVMHGEEYGPYENQEVELPVYAALYLLLKKVAHTSE
ncbi:MAG TPA: DNA primase catalytic subunit PriS [Candidatus Acidoferrum sp.]|nr:DNA primase catalytic subunit PriS [Candidatus Acidoferrum sp.]